MDCHGDLAGRGVGSSRRRRERRLRSWWRHECQSVRMALTAATHHSAAKVVAGEMDSGLRAQTTVSAGSRPAALKELLVGGLGAPRCPGSGVPSLALAVLGGGDDGVDASCLAFLVRRAVEDKKEEEEEERKQKVQKEAAEAMDRARLLLEQAGKRRRERRGGRSVFLALLVSTGVWVLPEEYTGSSPASTHCLVSQWIQVPASVPEAFWEEFHTAST